MENKTSSTIFMWLYRIFCYYVPSGVALWSFLIKKLIDNGVETKVKLGLGAISTFIVIAVIGFYFYKRHFDKKIQALTKENDDLTDKILLESSEEKKVELLNRKKEIKAKIGKINSKQELFNNVCFVSIFVIAWLIACVLEKGLLSLRGTLLAISISMASGLGFNGLSQYLKNKE